MTLQYSNESPCSFSPARGFKLTQEDKRRLESVAPWFNLSLQVIGNDSAEIVLDTTSQSPVLVVNMDNAHKRLMAEVCSRAGPWVYFHVGMSCRDSLGELTDLRLRRIGDLYRLRLTQPHSPA